MPTSSALLLQETLYDPFPLRFCAKSAKKTKYKKNQKKIKMQDKECIKRQTIWSVDKACSSLKSLCVVPPPSPPPPPSPLPHTPTHTNTMLIRTSKPKAREAYLTNLHCNDSLILFRVQLASYALVDLAESTLPKKTGKEFQTESIGIQQSGMSHTAFTAFSLPFSNMWCHLF